MKATFLMTIYASRKDGRTLDEVFRSAKANQFRMFLFNGYVYSTEVVAFRTEKQYADMNEAILFKFSELI